MSNLICDASYLFWIWFALALLCILIVLGGIISLSLARDYRQLTRIGRGQHPDQP